MALLMLIVSEDKPFYCHSLIYTGFPINFYNEKSYVWGISNYLHLSIHKLNSSSLKFPEKGPK